jgi:hypothetical protein
MAEDIKTTSGKMRSISQKTYPMDVEMDYSLPCFEVKQSDIPESEEWYVGEDYKIELLVTQKAVRSRGKEVCVEFQIKKIKAL